MSSLEYPPGNISDQFKHQVLHEMVAKAELKRLRVIDTHSGEGMYQVNKKAYMGTAMKALFVASTRDLPAQGYVHEIRDDAREMLAKNVHGYDVQVRKDWRDHIHDYIKDANKETLFIMDPYSSLDYNHCDNTIGMPLMEWTRLMMRKESGVFAYMNEHADGEGRKEIKALAELIRNSGMTGIDLIWPRGTNWTDHILATAHQPVLDAMLNKFMDVGRETKTPCSASILLPNLKAFRR